MKRNKIGAMFLVSVLALAGVGISYAGFTDAISVYGEVDTATVTLEIVGYSCTYVWKIYDFYPDWNPMNNEYMDFDLAGEIVVYHGPCADYYDLEAMYFYDVDGNQMCTYEYLSWAKARAGADPFDIEMDFHNLFPCIDFTADFILHYTGSIPARVNIAEFLSYDAWLEDLWNAGAVTVTAFRYNIETGALGEIVDIGTQLHYCDYVIVFLTIHLPQDNIWQGQTGSFTARVGVIQWNDLCLPPVVIAG